MSVLRTLPRAFYDPPAERVARALLGALLLRELPEGPVVARLVEVEAYVGPGDRASHAYGGRRTPRNESMYLAGGHAYVYRIYGIHRCLNVVTGPAEEGIAVLLRGAEIVSGDGIVRARRSGETATARLLAGPGNLCRGLGVDMDLDGHRLDRAPLRLAAGVPVDDAEIVCGPRVGCESAGEAAAWPLRLAVRAAPGVSYPRATLVPWVSGSRASGDRRGAASRPRSARRADSSS